MTESEWLASEKPTRLFQQVRGRLSARKLKLLACGCCRLLDPLLTIAQRQTLAVVERHADGLAGQDEYQQAEETLYRAVNEWIHSPIAPPTDPTPTGEAARAPRPLESVEEAVAHALLRVVVTPADEGLYRTMEHVASATRRRVRPQGAMAVGPAKREVERQMCAVFREIVGNPFRETRAVGPEWLAAGGRAASGIVKVGETARAIARGVEADQAYDRLPILADALEDDGCSDLELLAHLRGNSHHLRGCWAVDLVLGKS